MKMQRFFGLVLVLALLGASGAAFVSPLFTITAQDNAHSIDVDSVVLELGATELDFGNTATDTAGAQEWQGAYFYYDAEGDNVGDKLPMDPPAGPNFWPQSWNENLRGIVQSDGDAPQGNHYFQWHWEPSIMSGGHLNYINDKTTFYGDGHILPVNFGETYYLAYFFRFDRVNGQDIWHEYSQSADKGVELGGSGLRWIISRGHWGPFPNYPEFPDHMYTVWMGNPTYHLNSGANPPCPDLEHSDIIAPNQNEYSFSNPLLLEYERWYGAVMAVNLSKTATGSIAVWINGKRLYEYNDLCTVASDVTDPTIDRIFIGGTVAQPAYDAPEHYRKFDALMLTDSWQDIVDGGYLSDPKANGELLLYGTPADQSIRLSWTVSGTLPVTSSWQIDYQSQSGSAYLPITNIISPTRAYTLTGLTNHTWYTVTLSAMSGSASLLADTVTVMPTGIFVYLPLVLKGN